MSDLVDRFQAHRAVFDEKNKGQGDGFDYSSWFLHLVVFPSLRDIALELDRVSARLEAIEIKRDKGGSADGG